MRAPKTPVATWTPSAPSASQKCSYNGSACSLAPRLEKIGRVPFRRVGDQRELADDERVPARVEQAAVELALLVLEDPQARDLAREPLGVLDARRRRPRRAARTGPAPISPPGVERARDDALDDGPSTRLRSRIRDS